MKSRPFPFFFRLPFLLETPLKFSISPIIKITIRNGATPHSCQRNPELSSYNGSKKAGGKLTPKKLLKSNHFQLLEACQLTSYPNNCLCTYGMGVSIISKSIILLQRSDLSVILRGTNEGKDGSVPSP